MNSGILRAHPLDRRDRAVALHLLLEPVVAAGKHRHVLVGAARDEHGLDEREPVRRLVGDRLERDLLAAA